MAESGVLKLHVGYGKTGSSSLQAWFAANTTQLDLAGVSYPLPPQGHGDSGNGHLLIEALQAPETEIYSWCRTYAGNLLLSREQLARELSEPGVCSRLALWARRQGFESVHALLLVRDPQEHCYSMWAQKVKRAGEQRSLEAFTHDYDCIRMATSFLQAAHAAGLRVSVRNYGLWRRQLLALILTWLDLHVDQRQKLERAGDGTALVNRTPSYQQLWLQRHLNHWRPKHLQGIPMVPSPWLAGLLPAQSPVPVRPWLLKRWRNEVEFFNFVAAAIDEDAELMPFQRNLI